METKIQLTHPQGKKAISMDPLKYKVIKDAIFEALKEKAERSHKELYNAVAGILAKNKTAFSGSVEWHLEWVKLDLESKEMIKRTGDKSSLKFSLSK